MQQPRNPMQVPATIGEPFEGGYYGGTIRMLGAIVAVIWAPKADGETQGAWLDSHTTVPGTDSCADSLTNTLALSEAGSPIAKWALDLRINGHDDWCLPARDVLELAYRHLKPTTNATGGYFRDGDNPSSVPPGYPYASSPVVQTSLPAFQAGGAEAFELAWYWSSTQYSESNAWFQGFSYGYQDGFDKMHEARVRAVRLIQLNP